MNTPELRYHGTVFRLFGRTPRTCPEAVAAIDRFDAESSLRLPAAVREWYSLEDVVPLLSPRDESCCLYTIESVLLDLADGDPREAAVFGPWKANTGYVARLELDGADDPPVRGDGNDVQPFTAFVRDTAWWILTLESLHLSVTGLSDKGAGVVAGPPHIDFLRERFEELPPAGEPGGWRTHRFFRAGCRVNVEAVGDPTTAVHKATYLLAADDGDRLLDLYAEVWPCHAAPVGVRSGDDLPADELVDAFRERFPDVELR